MEAFKKIPSSFGVLVRKPGLGVKYPPLATRGLILTCMSHTDQEFSEKFVWTTSTNKTVSS